MSLYRITGTRPSGTSTVEFQDATVFIEYTAPNKWAADIVLEPGRTDYPYRFLTNGAYSSWRSAQVALTGHTSIVESANNTLDAHGALLGTPRLEGEENDAYRTRLLDVFTHRGSSSFHGLVNSMCRDLGVTYHDQALVIDRQQNPSTGHLWENVTIQVSVRWVWVTCAVFRKDREKLFVDPGTLTVTPSKFVASDLVVEDEMGTRIDPTIYRVDSDGVVHVFDRAYEDLPLYLSYRYFERVDRSTATLTALAAGLNAIVTPAGDVVLDVTVESGYGSELASGLSLLAPTVLRELHDDAAGEEIRGLPVRWSDFSLTAIHDEEFQDLHRSWTGSLWNTRISSYALWLRKLAKASWGAAVADDSIWGTPAFPLQGGCYLDTIFDAYLGAWLDPIDGTSYDVWMQRHLDGRSLGAGLVLVYSGVLNSDLQSGVGGDRDLTVVVESDGVVIGTEEEGAHEVSFTDDEVTVPDGFSLTTAGIEIA